VADVWGALETAEFAYIVAISLFVSFSATAVATVVGLPLGAALAICRFPGRRALVLIANAFLGLPLSWSDSGFTLYFRARVL